MPHFVFYSLAVQPASMTVTKLEIGSALVRYKNLNKTVLLSWVV